jgi:hypothetical protein
MTKTVVVNGRKVTLVKYKGHTLVQIPTGKWVTVRGEPRWPAEGQVPENADAFIPLREDDPPEGWTVKHRSLMKAKAWVDSEPK